MTSTDSEAVVSALAYREAMAQLASAVHLVTTDGPAGRAGLTASSVCSVSDDPPTLLVCLNRGSSAYSAILSNGVLGINTLCAGHEDLAADFAGRVPSADRFNGRSWSRSRTGAPILPDALIAFDCRIADRHSVGTHDVLICTVVAVAGPREANSLLYANRRYRILPRRTASNA